MTDARKRFEALALAPEAEISLAEAGLWIAAEEYPDLDVPAWLRRLDALGHVARERVAPRLSVDRTAATLNTLLFVEHGFRGNRDDYYDPRNSFLNEVLERRLGIPITLSVVYIEVAARAGVTVRGIGLPGHFVVRMERHGVSRLLDPFNGGVTLTEADCDGLVRRVSGQEVALEPAHLAPVTTRTILTRMLGNLKGIYLARGDWRRALQAVERILLLRPDALSQVRDRGLIHANLGAATAAIRDWETYLQGVPRAADADQIRGRLRAVRQALAVLN
ncbi:MAG: SirB1 family protein [Candidatus Rokuibacteriota bacterium]